MRRTLDPCVEACSLVNLAGDAAPGAGLRPDVA
jgi:hypothetical protein